jgi:shikimate kinase
MSSILSPGRNLVLTGLMGTGKTAVGRRVAERLGRPFVDTDAIVERETGTSIAELFATVGERGFRDEEAAAIRHNSSLRGQVIAVGGGAVVSPSNVTHLRSTGDIVLLTAPADVLRQRLEGDGVESRPLLADADDLTERLARLGEERAEAYRAAAVVTIDTTGRSVDEIADEVIGWARERAGLLAREERRELDETDG